MNHISKLTRSRWLLLTLFTLLVGVSPAWAQQALPYSYGFEDNDLATDGWTKQNPGNNNSSKFIISTSAKQNGTYGFQFSSYDGGTANQLLISPELNAPSGVVVSFAYKNSSSYGAETFKVGYSTTDTDPASFTWGDPINESSVTWKTYEETYPSGTKYIAVNYSSNNKYYLYVDDFSFTAPPTCIKPTGLTSTDISSFSVDLSWTSTADNFQIQYKKTSDGDWTLVNEILDAPTYTLSGLLPAKNYQVRVRTYCSAQDQSDWTEPVAFTTDCATITSFPFTENFNDLTSGIPVCWDNSDGNTGTASYNWNFFATGHTGACVRFNSYNTSSGKYNSLKTPAMNFPLGKTVQLSFWWKNPAGGDFSVYISNDGGSTYTTSLKTGLTGQSSWKQEEIIIPAGFSENVVIVFKATSNCGYGDAYVYLDDIVVEETSGCIKPSDLVVSNIANTSVCLGWTSDGDTWNIRYKTGVGDWTTVNGVTANPYTITGLTAETAYEVQMQTDCGGSNQSAWTSSTNFTTKPNPITAFPFEENFNGLSSGIPTHWDNSEGTTTNDSYNWNYNASGHEGKCVMFNSYNNQNGIWNALKTPAMNLPSGKVMQLNFWYKYQGNGDLSVYISNDGGDTYSTALVTGLKQQSEWKEVLLTLPNEFQEQENVVIVFKGTSDYGSYNMFLDDVAVKEASSDPVLTVSTDPINFGIISSSSEVAAKQRVIAIENTGAGQMTGVTISYTATSGDDDVIVFTPALSGATINGNASQNVTATVDTDKLGAFSGTIRVAATDLTPADIPVSGYVLDGSKIAETFTSAAPAHWTEYAYSSGYSTYNWSYSADGAYNTSENSTLSTPKIVVAENETLVVYGKLKNDATYGYILVEGSSDNGATWVAYSKELDYEAFSNTTNVFQLITLSDVPTTINKLRFKCYYAYLNAINGFSYVADPVLSLYSDEECTLAQAETATKNFGFVAEAQQQKYYIKNTGTGQIDLTIEQADGFTAAVDDAALTENEKATLTITMPATEGLHDGTITVTAKNHDTDAVLGTFEVALNGAVAGSKNDVNFASLSDVPAGWDKGSWTVVENSYVQNNSGTAQELTTATYTVGAGETLLVEAQGTSNYNPSTLTYSYKAGEAEWTEAASLGTVTYNNWKVYAITGIPTGDAKVKFSGTYVRIRRIYGFTAKVEPFLVFTADGTTKNFGMITAKATSDAYTITNSGTALLDNLSVTCDNDNFEIAVADNATSIAAGSNVTFTVALKTTALGSQSGTVTIAGDGVESKTLNVKGFVADNTKIFTTFTALPDRWTNSSWTFDANGATATSSSSKLETPKIIVAEGQKLAISAKQRYSGSSYYVTINGSSDNGATWTAYTKTLNNAQLNNTDYTVVELDDVPTTVNKLQLVGYYVYVNGLNGFTYDENDPEFSLFSDEECNTPIATTTVTNAWGFVNEDKTATYYIKNTGTGTLNLTKTDAPTGFTATLGATSLTAGEKTSLTIAMANNSATNEGYHAGDVVLTAKDNADNTLGTFTVTSSGVVVGSKTDINFTTLDAFPAGWETTSWSVTANTKATVGWNTGTLTTGTYTVAGGEKLVVKCKKNGNSGTLSYKVSTDGGSSWSAAYNINPSSTSEYELKVIEGVTAGSNVKIEFTGYYVDIERIYGYTAVLEPVMTLSPAAVSYDFGMQTAAAEYVITVTNSGTADMTNLAAALTGDDADDFEVAVSKTTVPYTGENTATVTVTLKASTEYKEHNATLTISADGLANKVITLKGKTRDASKNYIDFASEIPSSFVEKGSWSVSSQYATTTSSTENSLITQPIDLAAGEKIYFDAKNPYSGSLKVRYSLNGGISWSDFVDYTAAISTSGNFSSHEIDLENTSAVTAIVEFKGRYYIQLDNVYGGVLNNEAPMIKVTKSAAVVESGATEAFGSISAEATATYAITNVGNGTLTITSPVTTTGVATATVNATSLTNGESATLTITMPVAAPYEYKEGVVTVKTSLGDFVINYNATILNPNALDEQFASGQPAGWYFGSAWSVTSGYAIQESNTATDLITEQLIVAGAEDVLTFKVKKNSSQSNAAMTVAYSTDRVNWTDYDVSGITLSTTYQTVEINGIPAGTYYLKLNAKRVTVDNFLGWTKKNNTRDLYVTATSFPATTTKGNEATITATVTSLITEETGVCAKLFIDGTEEETAAAQDIALNGTKTFSFSYAIPENKSAQINVYYSDDDEAFATAENAMKVNYTMDENTAPASFDAGTYNVTLTYTKGAEKLGTICLPFATTTEELSTKYGTTVKIYELTSHADHVISFSGVENLDAGKPYLIYSDEALSGELTFADKAVVASPGTTDASSVTFHGIYAPTTAGNWGDEWYGVTSAGKIAKGTSATTMNGLRAYFTGDVAIARIFIMDDEDVTGIAAINREGLAIDNAAVYNLNGQKVQHAKKGLYIVNGKKVVIK